LLAAAPQQGKGPPAAILESTVHRRPVHRDPPQPQLSEEGRQTAKKILTHLLVAVPEEGKATPAVILDYTGSTETGLSSDPKTVTYTLVAKSFDKFVYFCTIQQYTGA
jgi:hypothetical protein